VFGYSAQNSSFSVMATLVDPSADPSGLGDIVQLQDGEQQNAVAAAGKYRYFMVTIPAGFEQLFIAITTLTGDPDVYVRYEPDHPTVLPVADIPDSYGWRSSGEGDDTITISNPTGGVYVIGRGSTAHCGLPVPRAARPPAARALASLASLDSHPSVVCFFCFYMCRMHLLQVFSPTPCSLSSP